MSAIALLKRPSTYGWSLFWIFVLGLSVLFLLDSIEFALTREFTPGTTFWNRIAWYGAHIVVATPILIFGPLQFVAAIRKSKPQLHRWLGRICLGASLVAAPLGIWLGATLSNPGSRLPIMLLGTCWFYVSAVAWVAARRKNYVVHRRFAIRSYGLGLAFVWIRFLGELSSLLFGYIPDEATRQSTQEWVAFVGPLLVMELWLSWWPALAKSRPTP